MSDIGATLRRAVGAYAGSYPGWITNPPTPAITTLAPASIVVATPTPVTVNGTNFTPASKVYVDGAGQITAHLSATQLRYLAEATSPGSQDVTVHNGPTEVSGVSVLTVTATVGVQAAAGPAPDTGPAAAGAVTAEQVSNWTVDEAKAFVEANPDAADDVRTFEEAGKARTTLLSWLDDFIISRDAPT